MRGKPGDNVTVLVFLAILGCAEAAPALSCPLGEERTKTLQWDFFFRPSPRNAVSEAGQSPMR